MASNILSNIYKQGDTVVKELQGMNNALKDMRTRDKAEYNQDAKHRKYQREKDKRDEQDQRKFQKKIATQVADSTKEIEKKDANSSLAAGLSVALAAAVAAVVTKRKKKSNEEQPPASTGGGRSMFIPTKPEAEDKKPVTIGNKDLNPKVPKDVKFDSGNESIEKRVAFWRVSSHLRWMPSIQKFQSGGFAGRS